MLHAPHRRLHNGATLVAPTAMCSVVASCVDTRLVTPGSICFAYSSAARLLPEATACNYFCYPELLTLAPTVCPQGSGSYYEPPLTGATVKAVQRSGYWAARKKPPFVAYPATKAVQNKFAVCSPCPIITFDGGSKQTAMSVGGECNRNSRN